MNNIIIYLSRRF